MSTKIYLSCFCFVLFYFYKWLVKVLAVHPPEQRELGSQRAEHKGPPGRGRGGGLDGLVRPAERHGERKGELLLALLGREADHPAPRGPLQQDVYEGLRNLLVALDVKKP